MVWWINKHKHSISIVHIFCVILFKAFCKFLRLRNSHGIFGGLIFGQGFFGGLLLEAPGISLGIDFCPHSIIPITWNPEYLQPWGRDSLFTRGTCLILHIYMYGLWGWVRAWVYSRKYSNCLKSCTWYKCEATNHHRSEVTQRRCYKYKFEIPESHLQCLPVKCPATVHGFLGWVCGERGEVYWLVSDSTISQAVQRHRFHKSNNYM